MPIFQDPDRHNSIFRPWLPSQSSSAISSPKPPRKPAHETMEDEIMEERPSLEPNMEPSNRPGLQTSSREELIRCIKNGESPTWVPNRAVSYCYMELQNLWEKRQACPRAIYHPNMSMAKCYKALLFEHLSRFQANINFHTHVSASPLRTSTLVTMKQVWN